MSDRRSSIEEWVFASDLRLLAVTLALVYVLFAILAALGGLDVNGIMSSLERITFYAAVYALLVLALNLQWGYAGLFNIGVAGFMAIGIYTMIILTVQFGWPYPLGMLVGTVVAGLFGALVALPAIRLRADYLAIVTLAFAEIVRKVFASQAMREVSLGGYTVSFGGQGGPGSSYDPLKLVLYEDPGSLRPDPNAVGELYFGLLEPLAVDRSTAEGILYGVFLILVVGLFYWVLVRIGKSPFGRVLKAIREDEIVARALGKDTRTFKIKAFALGSALMGLAAMLWFLKRGGGAVPDNFLPETTFFIFVALIIGGSGSNTGSVLGGLTFGAVLFQGPLFVKRIVENVFDPVSNPNTIFEAFRGLDPFLAYALDGISSLRIVLLGVILVVLIQRRPKGLLGARKEIASGIDLETRTEEEP